MKDVVDTAKGEAEQSLEGMKPAHLPRIIETRAAFKALGKDPSRYRPSSEALLRRIASGKGLYTVNDVVDINNVISMQSHFPIGTYDLAELRGDIVFRRGEAGETYQGIGRYELNLEGLPLFADEAGPFGTPFSDSERTMVRPETSRVLSVLIGFGEDVDLQPWLEKAADLLTMHCCATDIVTECVKND